MTDPAWRVEVTRTALKDLKRLDPPIRQRIQQALVTFAADPHVSAQLRKLTGAPEWRLRVGDWRVLLLLDDARRIIEITRVLPRGRAYRDQ